jgi:predicted nicotinamide N-methyase
MSDFDAVIVGGHEEGGAGKPVPYWARPWPSGIALAQAVAASPPARGASALEIGCGLGLPSLAAARADVLYLQANVRLRARAAPAPRRAVRNGPAGRSRPRRRA